MDRSTVATPGGKDTLKASIIHLVAKEFSKMDYLIPINADTLTALSFGNAVITFNAIETFSIDLADVEYSHINIDRRRLFIKHTDKPRLTLLQRLGIYW